MSKILLAYSGGLDSAVILHWLASKGHEVTAFTAQLGGHEPTFQYQALDNGATASIVEDLREPWVEKIAATARGMDAAYGKYFMHVALGKIIIAEKMAAYAKKEDIEIVAHGAHKGENDYHRLGNMLAHIAEIEKQEITVYAPWEDSEFKAQFPDRDALLAYTVKHSMTFCNVGTLTSEPTILGVNYENGPLLNIHKPAQLVLGFEIPATIKPQVITIYFEHGNLAKLEMGRKIVTDLMGIVEELNAIGTHFGVGFVDTVETNIDDSKARCVYVQPATTLWHEAHMDLGNATLTGSEVSLRDTISRQAGELIYHGHWFSAEMDGLREKSRELNNKCNGWVKLRLHPGFANVLARSVY